LDNSKTRVYVADITPLLDEDVFSNIYQEMSPDRRQKVDRIKKHTDKARSAAAGKLLERAYGSYMKEYYHVDAAKHPEIVIREYGKPFFANGDIYFNLSHAGDRVMCALSTELVGCDVEYRSRNSLSIAKRFFTAEEYDFIKSKENDSSYFTKIWTLKESVLKASGQGISYPMNSFSVVDNGQIAKSIVFPENDILFFIKNYTAENGYEYSCCTKELPCGPDISFLNLI